MKIKYFYLRAHKLHITNYAEWVCLQEKVLLIRLFKNITENNATLY